MTGTLILLAAALAAVAWLIRQPAFAHDTPHKQAGALIAITAPFVLAAVILSLRSRRRNKRQARSPQAPAGGAGQGRAGRW